MDKIVKSPIIILLLSSFCCVSGTFVDVITEQRDYVFGPIGLIAGLIIGFVSMWRVTKTGFFSTLNQWINPYFKGHREFTAVLTVACPESQAFHFCASMLHASNLSYELHPNLGAIIALQPGETFFIIPNMYVSFGVDITVNVESLKSGSTLVAIGAESRRSILGLWSASWKERWNYEAKATVENLFKILFVILDRQGIEYGEYMALSGEQEDIDTQSGATLIHNTPPQPEDAGLERQYQQIMQRFQMEIAQDNLGPSEGLRICLLNNNHGLYDQEETWFRQHPVYAVRACDEAIRLWNPQLFTKEQLLAAKELYQSFYARSR